MSALGFCNQVLPDLQGALKWRTLQPTTIIQLLGVSHILGSVHTKKSSTRSNPIGDGSKGSTIDWYLGIVQGSGKILYTCNRLFLISGFLGVVTWNLPSGVFFLREVFPICQQITVFIYFSLHLVYLVICWCLHDLHVIWTN